MTIVDLLTELVRRGVRLQIVGDHLRASPFSLLTPDLTRLLKSNKSVLMDILHKPFPTASADIEFSTCQHCQHQRNLANPAENIGFVDTGGAISSPGDDLLAAVTATFGVALRQCSRSYVHFVDFGELRRPTVASWADEPAEIPPRQEAPPEGYLDPSRPRQARFDMPPDPPWVRRK